MRALVVDNDSARLRAMVAHIKEHFPGVEIVSSFDCMWAVKYAYNHAVDVIFTACHMRPIDGYEFIRLVRQKNPQVTVYVMDAQEGYQFITQLKPDDPIEQARELFWNTPPDHWDEEGEDVACE